MIIRVFKKEDGSVMVLELTEEAVSKGITLDDETRKIGYKYPFKDIEKSSLPPREYREEWRTADGEPVFVPTHLKRKRDILGELKAIDNETLPRGRGMRETRIAAGIASDIEVLNEERAKQLRLELKGIVDMVNLNG